MKTLGLLGGFCSIVMVCLSLQTLAQNNRNPPPEVNQGSSLSEIVDRLDQNSFSHARIGLEFKGSESYADPTDSLQSINLSLSRLSEELIFSPGFRLVKVEGCRLTLQNDQIKILSWGTASYDTRQMSFAKFLLEGKKGERKLTPQSALLFIPLDKLSYKGGKKPHRYTRNSERSKLLGTWRTEFKEKGFFRMTPLEMQITAAEGPDLTGSMNAGTLTFTFDDKEMSEQFNAAFRQAIRLCSAN